GGSSGGGFIICIRDSRQTARNVTRELVNIILQTVAVGAIISAALSIVFAQALLRPVRDMTKAAGSMAGGDFSAKIGVDASDEVGGLAVAFNDMAQQLESTLSELKEEESRRREFVANVSHELRTPLTSIISYSETLVENLDMPDDMREEFLNVIMNESDRMATIVQNLLELSRFDSGRWQMNFEPFSLERSVREVYSAVALEAKKHSHRIDLAFERRLPDVLGDKSRIEEVLMNVITNAIKYTPDGGEINVSTGRSGERIWIRVRDTGIGIPEADLPRVFDRFYRVDKARSRASGGTGLGLAIAKEIVERHGGEILMKSAEGVGTTVTIYLPAALEDGEQARA
ncbi:MAG: HAMP domain-containing protein, partial [Oscillospiraceae bacterium]|nr:HAMP domain-containing protein [Oscillospiraceae bacterium]